MKWDIGEQYSSRCDATECGIPSGANLFAQRNGEKNTKSLLNPLTNKVDSPKL